MLALLYLRYKDKTRSPGRNPGLFHVRRDAPPTRRSVPAKFRTKSKLNSLISRMLAHQQLIKISGSPTASPFKPRQNIPAYRPDRKPREPHRVRPVYPFPPRFCTRSKPKPCRTLILVSRYPYPTFSASSTLSPSPGARNRLAASPCCRVYKS